MANAAVMIAIRLTVKYGYSKRQILTYLRKKGLA